MFVCGRGLRSLFGALCLVGAFLTIVFGVLNLIASWINFGSTPGCDQMKTFSVVFIIGLACNTS